MDGGTDGHRPQAATMADIETFVSQRTTCTDLHMEDKDSEHEDDPEAVGVGKLWGIKERGVCWGDDRNGVTLMSVDDMKSFQTQAKKHEQDGWYLLGEDFVVTGAAPRGPTSRVPGSSHSSATRRTRSPVATRRKRRSWTGAR